MKIINPTPVTDETLVSSTIAEDDYSAWSDAVTYAAGDYAISVATHTIYRSLTADNLDNDPDLEQAALADPLIADPSIINWLVIGATDRWKLFDSKPTQAASEADNITVVIAPGSYIGGVAGFGISAASVTVSMVLDDMSRKNLLTFTEQFDNAAWTKSGDITVIPNSIASPDGFTSADTIEKNSGTFAHVRQAAVTVIGQAYTASFYVKQGTAAETLISVLNSSVSTTLAQVTVNWSDPEASGAVDVGDGWYRVSIHFTAIDLGSTLLIYPSGASASLGSVYAWGAQIEEGSLTDYQRVNAADDWDKSVYTNTLQMTDETAVIDWFSYFFTPVIELSEFVFTDLPPYADAEITVSLDRAGGIVRAGQVVMGEVWQTGLTFADGSGFSGLDFSTVEADIFGNLTRVTREATRLSNFQVFLDATQLLSFDTRMRSLRGGVAAVWIGAEDNRKAAINYGILRDYRVSYQTPDYSVIQLETQGLV